MKSILNRLGQLSDGDLQVLSEALDTEIERRTSHDDTIPESARRRAIQRSQSYRHKTGASALPVMATGLRDRRKRHRAA
jgi:hypothetical protein